MVVVLTPVVVAVCRVAGLPGICQGILTDLTSRIACKTVVSTQSYSSLLQNITVIYLPTTSVLSLAGKGICEKEQLISQFLRSSYFAVWPRREFRFCCKAKTIRRDCCPDVC